MVYSVELFETKNRMIGTALTLSVSLLVMPIWLYFKDILINNNYNPCYALVPFALMNFISTFFL